MSRSDRAASDFDFLDFNLALLLINFSFRLGGTTRRDDANVFCVRRVQPRMGDEEHDLIAQASERLPTRFAVLDALFPAELRGIIECGLCLLKAHAVLTLIERVFLICSRKTRSRGVRARSVTTIM